MCAFSTDLMDAFLFHLQKLIDTNSPEPILLDLFKVTPIAAISLQQNSLDRVVQNEKILGTRLLNMFDRGAKVMHKAGLNCS